jgi:TPR repeat protein
MNLARPLSLLLSIAFATVAACGGSPASNVAPRPPSAAEAFNEDSCPIREDRLAPLIVDWPSHQRGELEANMKSRLAVVSYDCQKIRLLPDCRLDGSYAYVGLNKKEDVIQLEDVNEVRANLPVLGPKLAVSGHLESGFAVDIATVIVGRFRTTRVHARPDELVGSCEGATHFVRGAHVGAFAVQSGSAGKMRAVAQLFSAGGEASSSNRQVRRIIDGQPAQCDGASSTDLAAPERCGALIRVQLAALATESSDEASKETQPTEAAARRDDDMACPRAFVAVGGKCVPTNTQSVTHCEPGNVSRCLFLGKRYMEAGTTQQYANAAAAFTTGCNGGVADACRLLGRLYADGHGVPKSNETAVALYAKACNGDVADACSSLGYMYDHGQGVPKDIALATQFHRRACDKGSSLGCYNLGAILEWETRPKKNPRAAPLFQRACSDGEPIACYHLGLWYVSNEAPVKNPALAVQYQLRACDGEHGEACTTVGFAYEDGVGVPKDEARARAYYSKGCQRNSSVACFNMAVFEQTGRIGGTPNVSNAAIFYEKACDLDTAEGCYWLGRLLRDGKVTSPSKRAPEDLFKRACAGGFQKACGRE